MKKWSFGIDNDKLIELVLKGQKTATTCPYDKNDIPIVREKSIICFSNKTNACVVKTKKYLVMKFKEMTEELCALEGEGDLTLKYWQKVHLDYFRTFDKTFNEDSKIIFEIFEVTKKLI